MHWNEAIRLIYKYNRFDFLETNLLPSIKTNQIDLLNEIKKHKKNFISFKDRLLDVRNEKAEKQLKEQMDLNDDLPDNDEMSQLSSIMDGQSTASGSVKSVATSINSQFSGRYNKVKTDLIIKIKKYLFIRTSKNKNKLKKKAVSLKKGSANEDLAIIQEISDLILLVYNIQGN
jgi:elongator complex protein 1